MSGAGKDASKNKCDGEEGGEQENKEENAENNKPDGNEKAEVSASILFSRPNVIVTYQQSNCPVH